MDDAEIVALYLARKEQAIIESQIKYGSYCHTIAENIVGCREDADECVNSTYLAAWNAIPPHQPAVLRTFLGKLTRRISLDHLRRTTRQKRGGGEMVMGVLRSSGQNEKNLFWTKPRLFKCKVPCYNESIFWAEHSRAEH